MSKMSTNYMMAKLHNWISGKLGNITALIPSQASSSNKLADKAFVNSSIATNTATFRGNYNAVADLSLSYNATHAQIEAALALKMEELTIQPDNNDYAFVQIPTADATPTQIAKTEKYKYNGTAWAFEYDLNNSGFTAAQWAAINSNATLELIGKLSALPTNAELITLLNGKQDVISDLSTIRSGASAGATAVQPASMASAIIDTVAESGVFDLSVHNAVNGVPATYADLSAALTALNALPADYKKGGMSIKFVHTYDNKYVQYRLMSQSFTTDSTQWQGVDEEPTAGSENLVESGGVFDALYPAVSVILTHGYYISNSGTYDSTSKNSEASDEFIPTNNAKKLLAKCSLTTGWRQTIAFYKEDKSTLTGVYSASSGLDINHVITIPDKTCYMRVCNRYDICSSPEFRLADNQFLKVVGDYVVNNLLSVDEIGNIKDSGLGKSLLACIYAKVSKSSGKNILCLDGVNGSFISSDGVVHDGYSTLRLLDYIKVKPSTNYYMSTANNAQIGSGASGICFYDENLKFISGITIDKSFTTPSNCFYIRCSTTVNYYDNIETSQLQLEEGTQRSEYVPYNPIFSYITEFLATSDIKKSVDYLNGVFSYKLDISGNWNLFDKYSPNIVKGEYLKVDGTTGTVASSAISDFIPIIGGQTYSLTRDLNGDNAIIPNPTTIAGGSTAVCFYDNRKNLIEGSLISGRTFTAPDNAYYLRTTFRIADINNTMVNKGDTRLPYVCGSPIYNYGKYLEEIVYRTSPSASICGRESAITSANSLSNGILTDKTFPQSLKSSAVVSAYGKISSFTEIKVGIGLDDTGDNRRGKYVKIDNTNIYFCRHLQTGEVVDDTVAHGLTINTFIGVLFIVENNTAKVIVNTLGGYFAQEKDYSYSDYMESYGYPFIYADSTTSLTDVTLESNSPSFQRSIWIIGDSYVSQNSMRWSYYVRYQYEFVFCLMGLAGNASSTLSGEFLSALKFGTPKYLIWAVGMNDTPDNGETPDPTWLNYTEAVLHLCNNYGVTPILCTIPNVPSRLHCGKNKWIRESGYRYVDFCAAVGATDEGIWYEGCLGQDEVHPTAIGAKALAAGLLKDFPEIATFDKDSHFAI